MKTMFKLELEVEVEYDNNPDGQYRPYTTVGVRKEENGLFSISTNAGKITDATPINFEIKNEKTVA